MTPHHITIILLSLLAGKQLWKHFLETDGDDVHHVHMMIILVIIVTLMTVNNDDAVDEHKR